MRHAGTNYSGFRRFTAGVAIGCVFLMFAGCGDRVAPLWKPVEVDEPFIASPQAIAVQGLKVEVKQLRPPGNEKISLTLPGKIIITAVLTRYEKIKENQFVWRGAIEGEPGSVVKLSVVNDKLVGDIITASGRMYSIRHQKLGEAVVEELDPAKFPLEERPFQKGIAPDPPVEPRIDSYPPVVQPNPATGRVEPISFEPFADKTTYIDVMVLYTVGVVEFEGDQEAVLARINEAISDTNTSYENSKVKQRVRLAHAEQTTYVERGDLFLDWRVLKGTSNKRKDYSADIVALITKEEPETGSCGQADQMHDELEASCTESFAVVPINCATITYSFAHELGHVMGADHNHGAVTFSPPFEYSHGYIADSNAWRTIMAYPTGDCILPACQRIPHWSNPSVWYAEPPPDVSHQAARPERTGSDSDDIPANNAASLNETADTVAKFSDACASQPQPTS